MQLEFYHSPLSLEGMLIRISNENEIKGYKFPIYTQKEDVEIYDEESIKIRKIKNIRIKKLGKINFQNIRRRKDEVVGIISKIDEDRHLRQLDIDLGNYPVKFSLDRIKEILTSTLSSSIKKGPNGFLVFTGNGFHYHGLNTIKNYEWIQWVEKTCSNPGIEEKWGEYQLKKGFFSIKVNFL